MGGVKRKKEREREGRREEKEITEISHSWGSKLALGLRLAEVESG